jgi:L-threonylcarbamoyladenylate synthase
MSPHVSSDIDSAVQVLRNGGLVAIPTETVYGLAACALDEKAVAKIYKTKGRPRHHPLIVHVDTIEHAEQWAYFDDVSRSLAHEFWPGPLTLLLKKREIVPDWVTGARESVAIRIPDHIMTLSLIEKLGQAIVAPSANRFGKVSPTSPQHVVDDLGDDVDYVLDGGACSIGVESTIVECSHSIHVLRPGAISVEDIERVISMTVTKDNGVSRAPGMMASHYAPRAKVLLCATVADALARQQQLIDQNRSPFMIYEPDSELFARNLYERLRQADREKSDVILVVQAPNIGIGIAINDRLLKAAADSTQKENN